MNLGQLVRKLQKDISRLTQLVLNIRASVSGGEANTASNIGAGGVGLYDSKVGVDLRFRNINAGSTKLSVALDNPNHEIDLDVVQAQIDHGSIAGLGDIADHLGYVTLDGTRVLTGSWDAGCAAGRVIRSGYLMAGAAVVAMVERLQTEARIALKETTDPVASAGYGKLWVSSADKLVYFMDSLGNIYDLTALGSGGGGGGAPADAEYIVGAADLGLTAERVKAALYDNYDLDDYPAAPDGMDDEFEDGSIDVKWTALNNPAAPNSLSEAAFAGFMWCGLLEYGDATAAFNGFVRLYQAPPGTAAQTYIGKVSLGCVGLEASADEGEWVEVGIYIGEPTGNDSVTVGTHFNDAGGAQFINRVQLWTWNNNVSVAPTYNNFQVINPTSWVYVKLEKTTANAWTSANTYNGYFSLNGIVWYHIGQVSYTFTNAATEIGVYFRRPKSQGGDPVGYGVCDFFRRIV